MVDFALGMIVGGCVFFVLGYAVASAALRVQARREAREFYGEHCHDEVDSIRG